MDRIFNIDYQYVFFDWINYYVIAKHKGMAPVKIFLPKKSEFLYAYSNQFWVLPNTKGTWGGVVVKALRY